MLHTSSSPLVPACVLHDSSLSCWISILYFPHVPIFIFLSPYVFSPSLFRFLYTPHLSPLCLPFTILSPPLSTSLHSHLSPFPSPCLICHSLFTCFSQLLFHFYFASHSHLHVVSSPRWTGRWTSSSRTAAWTSTTVCSRSYCSSNTWCGASVMSGSTSREQVRRLGLHLLRKKREQILSYTSTAHKIFIEGNVAIPLCFIYTKHISCQWVCCKTVCFSGLDGIDQWKHVCRLHKWISWWRY